MWPAPRNAKQDAEKRKLSFQTGEGLNSMAIAGTGWSKPRWERKNFEPPKRPSYSPPQLTELGKKLAGLEPWE